MVRGRPGRRDERKHPLILGGEGDKPQTRWYTPAAEERQGTSGPRSARRTGEGATWRRGRKQEENEVGARRATPGRNHERDGDVEHAAERRERPGDNETKRRRRDDRVVALSEREVASGSQRCGAREKDFPER